MSRELRGSCGGVAVGLRWGCQELIVQDCLRQSADLDLWWFCWTADILFLKYPPRIITRGKKRGACRNAWRGKKKGTPRVVWRGKKRGACRIYWRNKQKTPPKLISRHLLHHSGVNSEGNPPIILRAIYYTEMVCVLREHPPTIFSLPLLSLLTVL